MASPIRLTFCDVVTGSGDQTIEFLCRLLYEKATFKGKQSASFLELTFLNIQDSLVLR